MRLLVVEDDLTLGPALQEYLQAQAYEVDLVDTGSAALEALKHEHYHLILLDLNLPDMNGLDVLRSLRTGFGVMYGESVSSKNSSSGTAATASSVWWAFL